MADLGKPLVFTNQELEELAEITEEDILRTNEKWRKWTKPWARNLLTTEQAENGDNRSNN